MAQNQSGLNGRSSVTRGFPGSAARVSSPATAPLVLTSSSSPPQNAPTVFQRPLSRSQLAPTVHLIDPSNPPPIAARPISLDTPRPDSERHRNLYLGAPLSNQKSNGGGSSSNNNSGGSNSHNNNHSVNNSVFNHKNYLDSNVTAAEQVRLPTSSRNNNNNKKGHSSSSDTNSNSHGVGVVTLQPTKRTLLEPEDGGKVKLAESSILCPVCRKCRCEQCATPRPLPSRWICSDSIHCGPEPLLDYLTCLCCVKALFYHCGKNHEPDGGVMCADKPCSCAPHRKFWRWGCMATMSLVVPCLCLYWPCKGVLKVTEKAYQSYHSHGCTCSLPHAKQTTASSAVAAGGEISSSEDEDQHHNRMMRAPFPQVILPPRPTLLPHKK